MARPLRHAYDQWTQLQELPRFMDGVAEVRQVDERTSRWVVVIGRERRSFEAVVTEQVPDTRIAWVSAGPPPHSGVVDFRALGPDRTRVTLQLDWEPQGLFDDLGDRLGFVARQVERDLRGFRRFVEGQRAPTGASRHTVRADAGSGGVKDGAARADVLDSSFVDDGRGRTANRPTQIPARGWLDITKRTVTQLHGDNVTVVAAGVAFYVFLAIVPALLAGISIYGLAVDPSEVTRQLEDFLAATPGDVRRFITDQAQAIAEAPRSGLGIGLAATVLLSLLSASKGMISLITALNVAYDEDESRKFLRVRLLGLVLTILGVLGAVVFGTAMVVAGVIAEELGTVGSIVLSVVRWPALGAVVVAAVAALYRYAPDRDKARWRWATPGALVATVLWLLGSLAFSVYVGSFGNYQETYGTFAGIVVVLLWLFLTAYAIVFGAEFDAEMERQTARDSTSGPSAPLGQRRAYAADTVAPSSAQATS